MEIPRDEKSVDSGSLKRPDYHPTGMPHKSIHILYLRGNQISYVCLIISSSSLRYDYTGNCHSTSEVRKTPGADLEGSTDMLCDYRE